MLVWVTAGADPRRYPLNRGESTVNSSMSATEHARDRSPASRPADASFAHAGHHHHLPAQLPARTMGISLGLTIVFVIIEALSGWLGHSLALLSDAGHNLADAAALGFSAYALWIANKPSHHGMTFGYHRVGILAALANALSLVVIALLILWEAAGRLRHPELPSGGLMV